jgi:hypothetical protein
VIGHERSPIETTHNDLRFAVEPLSGGLPLTIYAESFESVRPGSDKFSSVLTNYGNLTGDAEKGASVKVEGGNSWLLKQNRERNGESRERPNAGQLGTSGAEDDVNKTRRKCYKEKSWLPKRYTNPNIRMEKFGRLTSL